MSNLTVFCGGDPNSGATVAMRGRDYPYAIWSRHHACPICTDQMHSHYLRRIIVALLHQGGLRYGGGRRSDEVNQWQDRSNAKDTHIKGRPCRTPDNIGGEALNVFAWCTPSSRWLPRTVHLLNRLTVSMEPQDGTKTSSNEGLVALPCLF